MKKYVIILFVFLLGLSWYSAVSEAVNNPRDLQAHLDKAEELEEKGIYVDAVTEYDAALEYDSENADIYVKKARALLKSGESREFISVCENTAENFQDDVNAMNLLMDYYEENDYEEKAVQYLQEFIESYPENRNAQEWFLKLKGSYTKLYCRYSEMNEMCNDCMVVKDDDLWGFADAEGNELIPAEYDEAYPFSEDGLALVKKTDGSWIYIDKDGQTRKVPDEKYENLGTYCEERALASEDGVYGYLDEEMEPAGKFVWDELTSVKNGVGAGKSGKEWFLVDENGDIRSEETYEGVVFDENRFCSAQKRIFVKRDGAWFLVNTKGEKVGDLEFEDARAFTEEGYAAVCMDGKWGFINSDGELMIDCIYDDAQSFQNGYAAVCIDGKWGYIDEEGNVVIEPEFTAVSHFSSVGTAAVQQSIQGEEKWQLIQLNLFR